MPIPSPLAFQPTALRNVAAGLVVGNPIGSSGTRAKALTAAELKAIVEASGISYLPLSGGTLTGAVSISQNSSTPTLALSNTTGHVIRLTDGTHTAGLIAYTSGGADAVVVRNGANSGNGNFEASAALFASIRSTGLLTLDTGGITSGTAILSQRNGLTAQCHIINKSYTSDSNQEALMLDAGKQISGKLGLYSYRGSSGGSNYPVQIGMLAADGTTFSGLAVQTDGVCVVSGICNPTTVHSSRYITLSNAAIYPLSTNITLGTSSFPWGGFYFSPPSSVALGTNAVFSVEMTSNTAGNLVYRGSDGTTRRMALAFS